MSGAGQPGGTGRGASSGADGDSPIKRGPRGDLAAVAVVLLAGVICLSLAAGSAAAATTSSTASVSPIDGALPTDPNGDGLYEDLNGNGEQDFDDVVTLFLRIEQPVIQNHTAAYDFNHNGQIDFDDVVTLFQWQEQPSPVIERNGTRVDGGAVAVTAGDPLTLNASSSTVTPGRSLAGYSWTFGDGTTASGVTATHVYDEPGNRTVTLRVTDDRTIWNETTLTVRVEGSDGDETRNDSDVTVTDRRVTAYYTSWARYQRGYMPSDVPLDRITHLNYAFLDVQANGNVTLGDSWGDRQNLQAFRNRSRAHPNTTFLLSLGGWTYSDDFSEAAATPERRARFAESAVRLMRLYGFDGLDVDWEYPGGGGKQGNTVGANDPHNFTLLLERTRQELDEAERADGQEYELTVAVSADPSKAGRIEWRAVRDDLDHVNVMTYDYNGAWGDRTNHNAPLYAPADDPRQPRDWSVNATMHWWADQPVDRGNVSIGLPFYGRSFSGVGGTNDGLYQSFTGTPQGTYGSNGLKEYWDVRQNLNASNSPFTYHWDDQAKVPYLYSAEQDVFVSFDDRRSIRQKVAYARSNDWGGVMIWALSHDRNGRLLRTVDRAAHGST